MDRPEGKENPAPAAKKSKVEGGSEKVLTFALSHSPVKVDVLESQTIYALVDIICRETCVGSDEEVDDHMWDVKIPGKGTFNSSDEYVDMMGDYLSETPSKATITKLGELDLALNTTMTLEYDYGSTSSYSITVIDRSKTTLTTSAFPRRAPVEQKPVGSTEFHTDQVDLNGMFPNLNNWITTASKASLGLNFFQAGKKHNYGFFERGNEGVCHIMFLPVKPLDLGEYLHTMDHAAQFKYKRGDYGPNVSWYSLVVFPSSNLSTTATEKYMREEEPGFCEATIAPKVPQQDVNISQVFPKLAALAGYGKKDCTAPKGWITYKNKILRVCSGKARAYKGKAPKYTAWDGIQQHEPEGPSAVLCETQVDLQSLHHLFCTVEGLLRSL